MWGGISIKQLASLIERKIPEPCLPVVVTTNLPSLAIVNTPRVNSVRPCLERISSVATAVIFVLSHPCSPWSFRIAGSTKLIKETMTQRDCRVIQKMAPNQFDRMQEGGPDAC